MIVILFRNILEADDDDDDDDPTCLIHLRCLRQLECRVSLDIIKLLILTVSSADWTIAIQCVCCGPVHQTTVSLERWSVTDAGFVPRDLISLAVCDTAALVVSM